MSNRRGRRRTGLWILAGVCLALAALVLWGRLLVSLAFSNAGMAVLLDVLHGDARETRLDAKALFEQALRWDARNRAAHRGLGWVLWQDGASDAAGQEWRTGGLTAQDFIRSGSWAWSQGDSEEALVWYERAVAVQPELGDGYYYVARLHESARRWDEALSLYDEALSKATFADTELRDKARDRRLAMMKGRCFRIAGTTEEAKDVLEECERVIEKGPEVGDAYYYAARALWFLGEREEALVFLDRALSQPSFSDSDVEVKAHLIRGEVLRTLDRFEEAVPEYEWVIARDSSYYWAYIGLGLTRWQGYGDADRAEEALTQAAALKPEWKPAFQWLGVVYAATGRRDEALDMYKRVLEIDPKDEWAQERVAALQEESR